LHFGCLLAKNKKMNATSNLRCGPRLLCIRIKSNTKEAISHSFWLFVGEKQNMLAQQAASGVG